MVTHSNIYEYLDEYKCIQTNTRAGVGVYWKSLKKYTAIQAPPSPVLLFLLNFHQIQGFPNWPFFLLSYMHGTGFRLRNLLVHLVRDL
jgi:hypothetical protein